MDDRPNFTPSRSRLDEFPGRANQVRFEQQIQPPDFGPERPPAALGPSEFEAIGRALEWTRFYRACMREIECVETAMIRAVLRHAHDDGLSIAEAVEWAREALPSLAAVSQSEFSAPVSPREADPGPSVDELKNLDRAAARQKNWPAWMVGLVMLITLTRDSFNRTGRASGGGSGQKLIS